MACNSIRSRLTAHFRCFNVRISQSMVHKTRYCQKSRFVIAVSEKKLGNVHLFEICIHTTPLQRRQNAFQFVHKSDAQSRQSEFYHITRGGRSRKAGSLATVGVVRISGDDVIAGEMENFSRKSNCVTSYRRALNHSRCLWLSCGTKLGCV